LRTRGRHSHGYRHVSGRSSFARSRATASRHRARGVASLPSRRDDRDRPRHMSTSATTADPEGPIHSSRMCDRRRDLDRPGKCFFPLGGPALTIGRGRSGIGPAVRILTSAHRLDGSDRGRADPPFTDRSGSGGDRRDGSDIGVGPPSCSPGVRHRRGSQVGAGRGSATRRRPRNTRLSRGVPGTA